MRTRPGCWECLRSDFHSTFSPEGRLFQVEYSLEAIKLGSTAIGVGIYFSLSTLPMSPWYSSKSLNATNKGSSVLCFPTPKPLRICSPSLLCKSYLSLNTTSIGLHLLWCPTWRRKTSHVTSFGNLLCREDCRN